MKDDKSVLAHKNKHDIITELYDEYDGMINKLGMMFIKRLYDVHHLRVHGMTIGLIGDCTITKGMCTVPLQVIFNHNSAGTPYGHVRVTMSTDGDILDKPYEFIVSVTSAEVELYSTAIKAGAKHSLACDEYYRAGNAALTSNSTTS